MTTLQKIGLGILVLFAAIGFTFVAMYFAVKFGFTNTQGVIDQQRTAFLGGQTDHVTAKPTYQPWAQTYEWSIIKGALVKDAPAINQAAGVSGVPARLIVAQLTVEQLRLFFSEREAFKQFFEPLKILGSQTQFSWGVMGMKEETAIQVEQHLKDPTSPYYLGANYEHLLDFSTSDVKQERFARMTDQHNHYYSYLYAGLYLNQVITQWRNAGYDISGAPDIISTLYNLGFSKSVPNPTPQSGGAQITVDGIDYSFGSLGAAFYTSDELSTEFPK